MNFEKKKKKTGSTEVLTYLYNLFKRIFQKEYFPENSSDGFILPICFKKGDKKEISNYRGITSLSTIGKMFTRILNID